MRIKTASRANRGVTLVELMVAMVILSTVVLGGMSSFRFFTMAIRQSRSKTIAQNIIQEKMEVLKNYSYFQLLVTTQTTVDNNYNPGVTYDSTAYPPETITLWGYPPFTRAVRVDYADMSGTDISTVSFNSSDTGIKLLTVYVLWKDGSTFKKIEIKNLFANPAASALDSGFSGTVSVNGGGALAGARVEVIGSPNWYDDTDSSGNYSFQVARGTYSLSVSSAGYFSASVSNKIAYRWAYTDVDFSLVKMASGTISGEVWLSTSLVISQVVCSSNTQGTMEVEWVSLYNPTTYTWTMDDGHLDLVYAQNAGDAPSGITLLFNTATLPPYTYYLIASTSPISFLGVNRTADAQYDPAGCVAPCNIMTDLSSGGVGIRDPSRDIYLDRLAWSNSGANAPVALTEGTALSMPAGCWNGDTMIRMTSTATINQTYGNAYDSEINSTNFFGLTNPVAAGNQGPNNSGDVKVRVSGKPAHGAVVAVNDTYSSPAQAVATNSGTSSEVARFTVNNVATGTWQVTVASGSYKLDVTNAVITSGIKLNIPGPATVPAYPAATYNASVLTSTNSGGFVQGYVYSAGANYWTPLSGILMEAGGVQARTAASGFYSLNVDTGAVTLTANYNSDNPNYDSASGAGTVGAGEVLNLLEYPYFHLNQGGIIKGYVTSGTGALPNVVVKAYVGVVEYSAPSDNTGYFYIKASTNGSQYTIEALLDPAQSQSSALSDAVNCSQADPLKCSMTVPGSTVFSGTITIAGGLGRITGSVVDAAGSITTGVLVLASRGAIADPPNSIYGSSAPALSNPLYAGASSADGTYTLEVRGTSYNMSAYYPVVNTTDGSVVYTLKTKTNVMVTAGATTSGQNFTWP